MPSVNTTLKMWDRPEGRNENISKSSLPCEERIVMGWQAKKAQSRVIASILL